MEDTQQRPPSTAKRGGWFRVEHEALQLIEDGCDPKRRLAALGAYTVLLRVANEHRASTFDAARKEIAAKAGMSVDTLDRAARELVTLGLLAVERGVRGGVNRWTLVATSSWGSRSERPGSPQRAVGVAAQSGSIARASSLRSERSGVPSERHLQEQQEEKKTPDGANGLSRTADYVGGEELLLTHHAAVIERHSGVRLRPPSSADREAASDLLARLGDDWAARLVELLTFALARPFWASKVATVAGLHRNVDGLAAESAAAGGDGRQMEECVYCDERKPCRWEPRGFHNGWWCDDCCEEMAGAAAG